jgi:hypothetical protein
MSWANDIVQSILLTAFDGEPLFTVFACERDFADSAGVTHL